MKYILFALSLTIVSCFEPSHQIKKEAVRVVKKLKPECKNKKCTGRYAYRQDDGSWLLYYFLMTSPNNPSQPYASYPGYSAPVGGSYAKENTKEEPAEEVEETASEEVVSEPEADGEEATSDDADSSGDSYDSGDSGGDSGGGDSGGDGGGGE